MDKIRLITSMTMTKKRQSSDIQQDKSDILSLLKAVERIYHLCQDVLNIHTQTSLMQSLAIESQMLLFKLRVMRERWHYHLPFKEACSVKLGEWSRRIGKMASGFAETANDSDEAISEYCPSKHFLLDLQAILPENVGKEGYVPYYQETDTKNYIVNQECIRKLMPKIGHPIINNAFPTTQRQKLSVLMVLVCSRCVMEEKPFAQPAMKS